MADRLADTRSKQGWLDAFGEWRAKRWNDRRAALIADIPSWVMLKELKQRGDLLQAEEADMGLSKGGTGKLRIGARPVDRYGLPLYRVKVEDDDA